MGLLSYGSLQYTLLEAQFLFSGKCWTCYEVSKEPSSSPADFHQLVSSKSVTQSHPQTVYSPGN